MNDPRFSDNLLDPHAWIQRRVGILEDHLYPPADILQVSRVRAKDIFAVKQCLAGARLLQAHQGARHRRLAAAALADQPQRFTFVNREIDTINGLDETGVSSQPQAAADGVMLDQPADLEDRCIARHRLRLRPRRWRRGWQREISGHRTPLARGNTQHGGPAPFQPLAAGMRGTRRSPYG